VWEAGCVRYAALLFRAFWGGTEANERYAMCAWVRNFRFSHKVISGSTLK